MTKSGFNEIIFSTLGWFRPIEILGRCFIFGSSAKSLDPGIATNDREEILLVKSAAKEVKAITRIGRSSLKSAEIAGFVNALIKKIKCKITNEERILLVVIRV